MNIVLNPTLIRTIRQFIFPTYSNKGGGGAFQSFCGTLYTIFPLFSYVILGIIIKIVTDMGIYHNTYKPIDLF